VFITWSFIKVSLRRDYLKKEQCERDTPMRYVWRCVRYAWGTGYPMDIRTDDCRKLWEYDSIPNSIRSPFELRIEFLKQLQYF
jgi:hypothetical protein